MADAVSVDLDTLFHLILMTHCKEVGSLSLGLLRAK